jgi:antitoxin ParD1/3/4
VTRPKSLPDSCRSRRPAGRLATFAVTQVCDWRRAARTAVSDCELRATMSRSSVTVAWNCDRKTAASAPGPRYASASEVIRDGLRLLEEDQQRRQAIIDSLRDEIERGRRSGKPKPPPRYLTVWSASTSKWPKTARSECARTSHHKPNLTWRRSATTSRSTILGALSRSFARHGNTASRMAAEALRPFRHLSPSIAPKQHFLTVDLTVKFARPDTKLPVFKCLHVLETIEWE